MSGRTATAATQRYMQALRAAVGCITPPIIVATDRVNAPSRMGNVALRNGLPIRLRASAPLYFSLLQSYEVTPVATSGRDRWAVQAVRYNYTFEVGELAHDPPHELVAFHWHPEPNQFIRYPHVHLGPAAGERLHGLDKAHIPTGRLSISDIVRFAVSELGVEPLRADWAEILGQDEIGL